MIFWVDCEAGGLDGTSLLTLYGVITNDRADKVVREIDLKLKPDDGKYIVEAQGMEVNGIDLIAHDKEAITYSDAKKPFYDFLAQGEHKPKQMFLGGQCVQYDKEKILESKIISRTTWDNLVSRRVIDTSVIGAMFVSLGFFKDNQSLSLPTLAKTLGVKVDTSLLHTAKYDINLNILVYQEMSKIILDLDYRNEFIERNK